MVKIGLVGMDVSHPLTFAKVMESNNIDMGYHIIYDDNFRTDEEISSFMNRFKLEKRVNSIEEMVDEIDVGFVQSCNWEKHLNQAMPFINKGKPVFIDKPIVGTMRDIEKINELVKNGAKIIGSSSVRYAKEIEEFLAKPIEERGEIVNVFGTSGVDEFNYGIHIVEAFSALVSSKAKSTTFVGTSDKFGDKYCETYFVEYENGVTGTYNTFIKHWHPFNLTVITTKGTFSFNIDTKDIYYALVSRIYDYVANKIDIFAPIEEITECSKIMLAGKRSRENGGGAFKLSDLSIDDKFDGYEFEAGYAKAQSSSKLYLNL